MTYSVDQGRAWSKPIPLVWNAERTTFFTCAADGVRKYKDSRIFYYYARWTGAEWRKRLIAVAGLGVHGSEPDYSGGVAIDPKDHKKVYLSSSALRPFQLDPQTLVSLESHKEIALQPDNRFELYSGVMSDDFQFTWVPITQNSQHDNTRPYVPRHHPYAQSVMWLHGEYQSYIKYNTSIYGLFHK